jgi:hypothetical protein
MGQILQASSCCTVNQENNNFGLHQFFEGLFLSEKKATSLYAVPAYLCWSCYKCPLTLQNMWLCIQNDTDILLTRLWKGRVVKAVTDTNEAKNDHGK